MPGAQVFTFLNWGKETTRGTPVAPTRQAYNEGTGTLTFDNGQRRHETENAGVRTPIRRVTRTREDVIIKGRFPEGCGYDDLIVPFSMLNGTATAVGAGADKTWTQTPSMTASNAPLSFSLDVGDDVQNWRVQYGMFRRIRLSAAIGDVTKLELDGFGQRAVKTAKANPAQNTATKIPGDLWTIKFATTLAGLPGASVSLNFLQSWDLEIDTGLRWRHYADGNLYGAQHVETAITGTLKLVVESTALAVSEFYDKHAADTLDFIRLKATGPALGGSNYSSQIDLPVFYREPEPIAIDDDGVNLYRVTADLAYDPTNGTSIVPVTVNSMTAMP